MQVGVPHYIEGGHKLKPLLIENQTELIFLTVQELPLYCIIPGNANVCNKQFSH